MHPFSIFLLDKHTPLLLRSIHSSDAHRQHKCDYDVLDGDNVVGRIFLHELAHGAKWHWSVRRFTDQCAHVRSGSAETLHDAKLAFGDAWEFMTSDRAPVD
jgi:hypothetical protein